MISSERIATGLDFDNSQKSKGRLIMAVDYKKEGRIAIFTINRPEAMNALDAQVRRELDETMMDFRDDPDLWVGIITGAGDRAFSAGADIQEFRSGAVETREGATEPARDQSTSISESLPPACGVEALSAGLRQATAPRHGQFRGDRCTTGGCTVSL